MELRNDRSSKYKELSEKYGLNKVYDQQREQLKKEPHNYKLQDKLNNKANKIEKRVHNETEQYMKNKYKKEYNKLQKHDNMIGYAVVGGTLVSTYILAKAAANVAKYGTEKSIDLGKKVISKLSTKPKTVMNNVIYYNFRK